jgi:hypothetical protein
MEVLGLRDRLSAKMDSSKFITLLRRFMISKTFMAIQCVIAAIFVVVRGKGDILPLVYGDLFFGILMSVILVICDDIIASTMPFLLACCLSIKCYDSFGVFINYIGYIAIPIVAVIFHFYVFHRRYPLGATWKGIIAVAIAVTLGGLGKISAAEYFSPTALYYTVGLGFGMFGAYILMNSQFHTSNKYTLRFHFSFIMTLMGLFCVFMIAHQYILYFDSFLGKLSPLYFQWRNNASTLLMLAMPFAFYLSSRKYIFIFAGFLQYAGILFTGSRGGALGGTIEFALCLIVLVYCDIRNRKKTLLIMATAVFCAITFFLQPIYEFFTPVLLRLADGDEIREGLIARAVEDFKSNIMFGRGLGYTGNTDVHNPAKFAICWYHSSPFQVIGSFGLVGVAAFVFQLYNRMKVLWARITQFNLTLFISYAGLFMMSLVNPGEFCPIPYGLLATLLFIICDKNNKAALAESNDDKPNDEESEKLINIRNNW